MINKIKNIAGKIKSKIYFDYNIGKLTWFNTGGNSKIFVIVENSDELEIILNEINYDNFYILGSGSNILVRDKGFDGLVIKLGKGFKSLEIIEDKLEVGASTLDINLSNFAYKNNIEGFEFFSGIPGSIGGAVKMNAGCFGSETKDRIESIEIYDKNFEKIIVDKNNLNLSYRSSSIKNSQIVSKATFRITHGDPERIKQKMKNIKNKRLSSQPIQNKTSGSTFKNPQNLYAAKLIENAGCKGMTFGNAYVSNKHANFLINNGSATASDLENLGKKVIDKVFDKFDIKLDWEVKIIGDY
tara:strand:+ start:632 stop:1528 length:897 start_codon:yes stop_codon:yes gene_type:complete